MVIMKDDMQAYKAQVRKRLEALNAVLKDAAHGNFTALSEVPPDEFSHLYAAVNLLLSAAQQKIEELHAIRAKDEAIIESVGEGLIVVDRSMRVTLINARAAKLLGFRNTEALISRKIDDVMPLEDEEGNAVQGSDRPVGKAFLLKEGKRLAVGKPYFYVRKKNGERFPISIIMSPIVMDGTIVGVVSVFRDVTEERRIDQAKSEFISLASHQLRTPLSIVSLNLEILYKHYAHLLKDKDLAEHLETIKIASRRMIDLVNELLNVSKIELGTLDIVIEPVDIPDLIEQCVKTILPLGSKKHITITRSFAAGFHHIQSDRRLLGVVIDNLLSNAVKYSQPDSKIEITTSKPRGGGALIAIRDYGCGIPDAEQGQIFSKLFRAENVRKREEGGTGLGLYIAHSIAEALGGSITFASRENKGTTFKISMPKRSSAEHYYGGEIS